MHLTELPCLPMGPQPPFDTVELERFVAVPRIATLAYTKRDNTPAMAPIWYRYEDGRFVMLTSRRSAKAKALARVGQVCLSIKDDTPPYRAVVIDGTVTVTDEPPDTELNPWLATHYFGRIGAAEFLKQSAEEYGTAGLTRIAIDPTRVRGFDLHKVLSPPALAFMRIRHALPIPKAWL